MSSIEQFADHIIRDAVKSYASDIHIIPRIRDTLIQFRIANRILPRFTLSTGECDKLISHFKFSASMDIGERRRPQNGAFTCKINGQIIHLRLSTLPSSYSESLVIRVLPSDPAQFFIKNLSLFPQDTCKLMALLKHAHGLILLTGPTGSGKSTTLYSLIHESSHLLQRNIITLEDPIEIQDERILQIQVNEKAGVSYASGLKAILRHDPDLIILGEIRDDETAKIAVRASLTGHLVLSTMHAQDAKGAIYRLLEFGVPAVELKQTLIAVTAQRLVEIKCPFCKTDCSPYCYKNRKRKRGSVFEMLSGKPLSAAIAEAEGTQGLNYYYPTLKTILRKAVALGYIRTAEYERWVPENE
ncbi:type II/IV secretion system protein [Bacillaceae bacterium Marseille-Q3522]|nr:type II/IV secretion system protein [Bacillaceae bacterium Marseille-Q3522]